MFNNDLEDQFNALLPGKSTKTFLMTGRKMRSK